MVSTSTLISLSMWVVPWILPRAIGFYHSVKAANRQPGAIQPTPPKIQTCLNILFVCSLISLVLSLPYFAPPNIFKETSSRLQAPNGVLFTRLARVRGGELTALDSTLKERYAQAPAVWTQLYAVYGPDALANCAYCTIEAPSTYMWYSVSALLIPHLAHILLLGLVTSSFFSGREGTRWRKHAMLTGYLLAIVEASLMVAYDWKQNITKLNLNEVDFYFWRTRMIRLLCFAAVDGLLGWALWLTSTNRWLMELPSVTEHFEGASAYLAMVHGKLQALGNLQNTILRDDVLRGAGNQYWTQEPKIMEEIEHEREVMDAKRLAISRMDYDRVQAQTNNWVDSIWEGLRSPRPMGNRETTD